MNRADNVQKELSIGITNIAGFVSENYYYVDKTPFIRAVLEDSSKALLITRPERFGKTLAMDTLSEFLRINPDNPGDTSYQDALFSQTQIYEDKDFCHEYMGKYPVLSLSLRTVSGNCYQDAYGMLAYVISEVAQEHRYLLDSTKLTSEEKEKFSVLLKVTLLALPQDRIHLCNSLKFLCKMLYNHFGKEVIVLIEECDVPMSNAYEGGYYNDMESLVSSMLSKCLNSKHLLKCVLTGWLRPAFRESFFTVFDYMKINSVANDKGTFAEFFGFTSQEVASMLEYYGLSEQKDAVKKWYGGYCVGGTELYCPCDVLFFCTKAMTARSLGKNIPAPSSYWTSARGKAVIQQFMSCLDETDAERMQALLDGGEAEFRLNEQLNYKETGELFQSDDFWSLLLFKGYLTCINVAKGSKGGTVCRVRIPNEAIRRVFIAYVSFYYERNRGIAASSNEIADAFFAGDADKISLLIESRLEKFVFIRNMAVKASPENYYHGFLNRIFSIISRNFLTYKSNAEAGDGCADIVFNSSNPAGVVIGFKAVKDANLMPEGASEALRQIQSRQYNQPFRPWIKKICFYGIAFCRKSCLVQCEVKEL